ncbi:hypothetical protein M569_17633 [Genlisea aurea]|uniref:Uncharacterized protein n=1 Tax=Genlisea aurea TaxID=192259 RepID=S8D3B7_9LAMI|nr:hypothetical protein M569_17633 [Genlisea aurea]
MGRFLPRNVSTSAGMVKQRKKDELSRICSTQNAKKDKKDSEDNGEGSTSGFVEKLTEVEQYVIHDLKEKLRQEQVATSQPADTGPPCPACQEKVLPLQAEISRSASRDLMSPSSPRGMARSYRVLWL